MIKKFLSLAGLVCIAFIAIWWLIPSWRTNIEKIAPILSISASIATLTVFAQFYIIFSQAKTNELEKKQQSRAYFVGRITALNAEILANLKVCEIIQNDCRDFPKNLTTPGIKFSLITIRHLVETGEITHHSLRAELLTLIIKMTAINSVIERNAFLISVGQSIGNSKKEIIDIQLHSSTEHILEKSRDIQRNLKNTQPLIAEFIKDPNPYNQESYLIGELKNQGLIQ